MNLWLLRPVEGLPDSDNPWKPWYGKSFGFVVRAETEKIARKLAQAKSGDEDSSGYTPWVDEKYATCVVLEPSGDEEIVIQDFEAA